MNNIYHRVSIRKYKDCPVEKDKLLQILKAGMQAPNACNQQPWEFYVVTDKETIQKLSQITPYAGCAAKAPVIIAASVITFALSLVELHFANLSFNASSSPAVQFTASAKFPVIFPT